MRRTFRVMACVLCFQAIQFISIGQLHFEKKIEGEEITYFSPFHEFAQTSMLTRCNGQSPIVWEAQSADPKAQKVQFQFLIGHSTGTSGGERFFEWTLNGNTLFTFHTLPKRKGKDEQQYEVSKEVNCKFQPLEYDINGDVFGWMYIEVPAHWVVESATFKVMGRDQKSRDWLMVFEYTPQFDIIASPTALILRKENKRQLNLAIQIPDTPVDVMIRSKHFEILRSYSVGYQIEAIPAYPIDFSGKDTIQFFSQNRLILERVVNIEAIPKSYTFHIIHHSHNDIGYSHHQTQVEKIQTENIRSAMRWAERESKAIWHIESLWAVENFLKSCTPEEELEFISYIKKGNLVLSANYANILTGLCDPKEFAWIVEYAENLVKKYNIPIYNAMMTDIPGITYRGLDNYCQHHIPYLSLGPNYVETHTDRGDRVGSVIDQTGDTWFYWSSKENPNSKVLVGTAGKGYSFFHNIQENEKQFKWENKISQYVTELTQRQYPWEDIQLRYTKNADNGPVDTVLVEMVEKWNQKFSSPTLLLQSVNTLFKLMEEKYGNQIATRTGEISPYWEDGAYSSAKEEVEIRQLVKELVKMENHLSEKEKSTLNLYPLHRNIVLFHEHTWGSWCSISDPYSSFTQSQWIYKKAFLDSAQRQMALLKKQLPMLKINDNNYNIQLNHSLDRPIIQDFVIDSLSGGIAKLILKDFPTISFDQQPFWQGIYQYDINPTKTMLPRCSSHQRFETPSAIREIVTLEYPPSSSIDKIFIEYQLDKKSGKLSIETNVLKEPILTKESLHFRLSLPQYCQMMTYGSAGLKYPQSQLPGSNKEFICSDGLIQMQYEGYQMVIDSPDINLFEIGGIMDENQSRGAKVWKRQDHDISQLFLYVFNNYWHTNYKAEQGGEPIRWKLTLQFIPK
jgi:hypothetical protein